MKTAQLVTPILSVLMSATGCQGATGSQVTIGTRNIASQPKTTGQPTTTGGTPLWVRYTDNAEGAFSM